MIFKILSKVFVSDEKIKAGEYFFEKEISYAEIFKKLNKGETIYRKILIPECFSVKQTVNLLLKNQYLSGFIEKLPKEGTLFPDTYFYERGENINKILTRMTSLMKKKVNQVWKINKGKFKTKQELVIFSSIIEAESKKSYEKKLISSVFHNRLKLRMKLQSDPTILYYKNLFSKKRINKIYRSDLKNDNPWNTYTRLGLPVTAICNPGIKALEAAINPSKSNYLFFVSDGMGGHRFTNNLNEHNKNIRSWKEKLKMEK